MDRRTRYFGLGGWQKRIEVEDNVQKCRKDQSTEKIESSRFGRLVRCYVRSMCCEL
jgi:hypothetical protein